MKIQYRIPQTNSQYVNAACKGKAIRVATIGSYSYIYEMDLNSSAFINGEYMRQSICIGKHAVLGTNICCIQDLNSDYNSLYQGVIVPFMGDPWRNGNGQIMKRTAQKAQENEDEEKVMSEADYYITNRHARTLQRVYLADKYRVPILSGVNLPMFPEILPQCKEEFVIKQYPTDLAAE